MKNNQIKIKGFTLIELLIIVAIIGILAAGVSISYINHLKNARCSRIRQDFDAISKAAQYHREVTGNWAGDVNTGATPAFVPDYLKVWPTGNFFKSGSQYDWENWPPPSGVYKAISFRIPPIRPGGKTYFYCVQDDSTPDSNPTNDCKWPRANPPTALNRDGTCP